MSTVKICLLFVLQIMSCFSSDVKPRLTLDEFFDGTDFQVLSFSPNGQYLLIQSRCASWNTSSFDISLWLYHIAEKRTKLITNRLAPFSKPQWSPSGNQIAFSLKKTTLTTNDQTFEHHFYLYSIISNQLISISVGQHIPFNLVWSGNDSSLFFTTILFKSTNQDKDEWKDVILQQQVQTNGITTIYRIDMDESMKITFLANVSFLIGEILFVPLKRKLVFTSVAKIIEKLDVMEIYSIDVENPKSMLRLTNNEGIEQDLKVSRDGTHVFFRLFTLGSNRNKFSETFDRLFAINLNRGSIESFAKDFAGTVTGYTPKFDGGVFILGQLGTEIQIYEQKSAMHNMVYRQGWNGSYAKLTTSSQTDSIAFVYSSFTKPNEVYLVDNIDRLQSAEAITSLNELFIKRELPQGTVYQWTNEEKNRTIEGILRYPPGQSEGKNLPLLVLIHGGLYTASINSFQLDWENWGVLAASEGWLVFEPNYRGSTGYGSEFVHEVRYQFLSRPGKDILAGIDQLIRDGIADPNRLAVGGYSYGGYLTNWLITQTSRFNAALSGAGAVEHTSEWGTIDLPVFEYYLLGGAPWEVPETYQSEAAIYRLDKVRTPTHIITGANDVRVNPGQSYMLERALRYLGIPVQLLIFPNEDHSLSNNPWHGKIKVREEVKWLQKYGHQPFDTNKTN